MKQVPEFGAGYVKYGPVHEMGAVFQNTLYQDWRGHLVSGPVKVVLIEDGKTFFAPAGPITKDWDVK